MHYCHQRCKEKPELEWDSTDLRLEGKTEETVTRSCWTITDWLVPVSCVSLCHVTSYDGSERQEEELGRFLSVISKCIWKPQTELVLMGISFNRNRHFHWKRSILCQFGLCAPVRRAHHGRHDRSFLIYWWMRLFILLSIKDRHKT